MKRISLFISILFCVSAYAANEQIPKDRTITEINVYEADVLIKFTPEFNNSQECPETSKSQIALDLSNEKGRAMYSAVLAAASAKKVVGFGIGGCKGNPLVYRVDVSY